MKRLLEIWRLLNAPCQDMTRLASLAMDTELPFWERFAVNLHFSYCRACRRYKKHIRTLREAVLRVGGQLDDQDGRGAELSPEARRRIADALSSR